MALTDHDTVAGVEAALQAAQDTPLEVIPGVEISTLVGSGECHLLGYFVDHKSPRLQEKLALFGNSRLKRAEKMVSTLNRLGVHIPWEKVSSIVEEDGIVGRPHIAQALVDAGHVSSVGEAFDRYLNRGGPAYVERFKISPVEAVDLIHEADGLPVLAHPLGVTDTLPELVDRGLAGLEVFYRGYSLGEISELLSLARRYNLVPTGGTDFHGRPEPDAVPLGGVYVPPDTADRLRERAGQSLKQAR